MLNFADQYEWREKLIDTYNILYILSLFSRQKQMQANADVHKVKPKLHSHNVSYLLYNFFSS